VATKKYKGSDLSQGEEAPAVNYFKRVRVRLTDTAPKHYAGQTEIVCGEVVANKLVANGQGEIIDKDVKIEGKVLED
jgi:hypothetical protein